jgi:hypothetical protein
VKFMIHLVMWVLIAWPPVSGFAAMGTLCHSQSSQMAAMMNGAQTAPCEHAGNHSDRDNQTTPISPACHGGACSFSCAGAAIPAAASLPLALEFSTVYFSLAYHHVSLFIPEQPQRPPLLA